MFFLTIEIFREPEIDSRINNIFIVIVHPLLLFLERECSREEGKPSKLYNLKHCSYKENIREHALRFRLLLALFGHLH